MKPRKTHRKSLRLTEAQDNQFAKLVKEIGGSKSDVLAVLMAEYENNRNKSMLKLANQITSQVSDMLGVLYHYNEFQELSKEQTQFLKALEVCEQLLLRTDLIANDPDNTVEVPDEMKDDDNPDDTTYKYALSNSIAEEIIKKII